MGHLAGAGGSWTTLVQLAATLVAATARRPDGLGRPDALSVLRRPATAGELAGERAAVELVVAVLREERTAS